MVYLIKRKRNERKELLVNESVHWRIILQSFTRISNNHIRYDSLSRMQNMENVSCNGSQINYKLKDKNKRH